MNKITHIDEIGEMPANVDWSALNNLTRGKTMVGQHEFVASETPIHLPYCEGLEYFTDESGKVHAKLDNVNKRRQKILQTHQDELTDDDVNFMVNDMSSIDMSDEVQESNDSDRKGEPKHWRKEALHQIHRKKRIIKARKANKVASKQRKKNR